ncbi:MAG: glycerophosphodiester phosphodiesterase family protein [Bacteroidales bacterium]|nr:glycerophosphodiester phosphodiesterase family protein [Bacteroidales bacterium]
MKRYLVLLLLLASLTSGVYGKGHRYASRADAIAAQIHDPSSRYVVVACHRGDWRNWPENSIPAIESVIRMGADIVEIDIHMTKDSVLVLCHDDNVRRTTNFAGVFRAEKDKSPRIADMTLAEIKRLSLKRAHGATIDTLQIPTLEEALLCTRGRICVNIDKGFDYYDEVIRVTEKLGVTSQVLIKSSHPIRKVAARRAPYRNNMMYMPVVNIQTKNGGKLFDSYMESGTVPVAYEVCWSRNDDGSFREAARKIVSQGSKVWVNTIWASLCGGDGNDDDAAFTAKDPGDVYRPYIDAGVSMIQTDRPELLIRWLKKTGHHRLRY